MTEIVRIIAIALGAFGVLLTIASQIISQDWHKGADLLDVIVLGGVGAVMLVGAVFRMPFGWYAGMIFGAYAFFEPLVTRKRKLRAGEPASYLNADTAECVVGGLFVVLLSLYGRGAFGF